MLKLCLAAAVCFALASCAPQAEIERERAYMAQVDRNPSEFQAVCEARAGARLIRGVATGGIATALFRWPEDQDLLFLWGAPFVEITSSWQRSLGAEHVPGTGPLGLEGHMTPAELLRAPGDASIPFRVRLLPDSDPRCGAGNSQRDTAIASGQRPGEESRWDRNGLVWPYANARHQTNASYYRRQCLAVIDATDDAAFHAPVRYDLDIGTSPHPPFSAGAADVRMSDHWRRLADRQTNEVVAEQASFVLSSVDEFVNYRAYAYPAVLNQCDGAERGRPIAIHALRPFAPEG